MCKCNTLDADKIDATRFTDQVLGYVLEYDPDISPDTVARFMKTGPLNFGVTKERWEDLYLIMVYGSSREIDYAMRIYKELFFRSIGRPLGKDAKNRRMARRKEGVKRLREIIESFDWKTLPRQSVDYLENLKCPGIYFLISKDERLLYVGCAKNIARRLKYGHKVLSDLKPGQECFVGTYLDFGADVDLEAAFILHYQPPLNVMGIPGKFSTIIRQKYAQM